MNQNKSATLVLAISIFGILMTTGIGWYVMNQVKIENDAFYGKVYQQYEYLLADFDIERKVLLMEFNSLMKGIQDISKTAESYWETPVSRGLERPKFISGPDITEFVIDSTYEWGTYEIANVTSENFTLIAKGNYTGLVIAAIIDKDGIVSWKPVKIPSLEKGSR